MRVIFILIHFIVFSVGSANAQSTTSPFKHLSVSDGLSHNSVNCILQDREGFIWFGTNEGLSKYDGYAFSVLQTDPADPVHSFRNNRVAGLCEGLNNRLWVVTEGGGLHEVDKQTGRVTAHPIQTLNASRWNNQLSVHQDSRGLLWVCTYNGLACYDPAQHWFTLYPSPRPEMPIKNAFEDKQNRFWVATAGGLYRFNRQTGRYTLLPAQSAVGGQPVFNSFYVDAHDVLWLGTAGDGLFRLSLRSRLPSPEAYNPGGQINRYLYLNAIHGDSRGIIWVATTDGLQRIDLQTGHVITYRADAAHPEGLSSTNVQAAYHDRAGTLWIGTNNGIDQQAAGTKPFGVLRVKPNGGTANLPENKVGTLLVDHTSRLWFGNQYALYQMNTRQHTPETVPPEQIGFTNQYTNNVFALAPDGSSGVWLGTRRGLYRFDQATRRYTAYPAEMVVQLISRGPRGPLWVGGEGGIASFDPVTHRYTYYKHDPTNATGLPDKFVYALLASRTGDVWVGVNGKGISRLNPATGRFTHYAAGPQAGQLNSNEVLTFYEDREGVIWAGTNQGGLNRVDPRTGLFSHITTRDGLPSNRVVGITEDRSGTLWLSTSKGLCRYDPRTKVIRSYDSNDGLPSNDFQENSVFRHNNRLYFGSQNGVVHFDPDSIRADARPFPVVITGFKVLDKNRPLKDSFIRLNHDENFLSIEFAALTYVLPEQSRYAYQLIGVDDRWVQNGNRRFVNYTNLPPGDYTFRVRASNSDDVWNQQGASVRIVIQPPWWATGWAYGLYTLLFGGALYGFLRYQTQRIRQRQELVLNRQQAEQLRAVDELKTRFFSNITHEFRTPLTLIVSPVERLLQEGQFDASTRQTLSLVQRNAQQLLRLINQLLDLSKLEAHGMSVALMRGRVSEFVYQLIESFQAVAGQKNVTLTLTAESVDEEQLFDAGNWEKIITNLLSNAIKFTGEGGRIAVTFERLQLAGPEKPAVRIVVADTGAGIAPERLPYIFDRFYQVDSSYTRAHEGTGIGLALVKELTELLGGTITVESRPDVGTTFTLLLPVEPISAHPDAPQAFIPKILLRETQPAEIIDADLVVASSADELPATAPLVLVVEDNTDLREFIAGELATSYRVLTAADGEEGWQLTQAELPDIVISDVMMPRLDGYALTQRIKNQTATDHIAVVLLTAKAAQQSRVEGLRHGADDYLAKPFAVDELRLRLHNLINRQQKLRDHYRRQLAQPDDTSASPDVVENEFMQRVHRLLDGHLDGSALNVDWLADELAMSRRSLHRKISSLTQLAPNELIRQYRLRKAADLLRAGHGATETAYTVGFRTPSHFTTVFKEFYGKTPSEFAANG